jgi:hypothetical protein
MRVQPSPQPPDFNGFVWGVDVVGTKTSACHPYIDEAITIPNRVDTGCHLGR